MTEVVKKTWRPRWWHWLIAFMVLLAGGFFGIAAAIRSHGLKLYEQSVAAWRAKGIRVDFADFKASAPKVDADRQNRYRIWSQKVTDALTTADDAFIDTKVDEWLAGQKPQPSSLATDLAKHAELIEEGLSILREGPVIDSSLGWVAEDFRGRTLEVGNLQELHTPSLFSVRYIATWLRFSAYCASDPGGRLDDLDRFVATLRRPGNLIEAMIMVAMEQIRDETYLQLAAGGTIDQTRLDRWLAETPSYLSQIADAFEGERITYLAATADAVKKGSGTEVFDDSPSGTFRLWLFGLADCATAMDLEIAMERRLRDVSAPVPPPLLKSTYHSEILSMLPNVLESVITVLDREANHRSHRLAALAIRAWEKNGALPADQREFGQQRLFEPTGDAFHLRYELLPDGHCRISIAPGTPLPNFIDPSVASRYATPRFKAPLQATVRPTVKIGGQAAVEIAVPVPGQKQKPGQR